MLKLNDISYAIGERTLFSRVNLTLNQHDRFGLVGANGTGKTTLLRIILSELSPGGGSVDRARGLKIGYLPQEEIVLRGNRLIDEVLHDFRMQVRELKRLSHEMSQQPSSQDIMKRYERAELAFENLGGYEYESLAFKIIAGLGFAREDVEKAVQEFSSGWQMRIVLARLLLNKPDLLLLDEPTNHLDIESIQWLENYLESFPGAMIIVSHDRYFLDKILANDKGITGILELDLGMVRKYKTDYSGYLHESSVRKQRLLEKARIQDVEIKRIQEFIVRNRANKKKARLVKSREKYLERLERVQVEAARKNLRVRFPVEEIHSDRIVELKDVEKQYDNKQVLHKIQLVIERGEKIALIGKNGAGKSTLCRIIAGIETPTEGFRKTSERLQIASFSHDILLGLDPGSSVLEEVQKDVPPAVNQNIRNFLGLFLFSGDDVFKKISVLSGGEKTRLVILKAMCAPSNMLILDEPTYHLDKGSIDAIRQAIKMYDGSVILVTHDRDLIADFATRIIELKNGGIFDYPGDYSYFLWKRGERIQPAKGKRSAAHATESRIENTRRVILQKEARREKLRKTFSRHNVMSDPRRTKKLFAEYQRLTEEIEDLERRLDEKAS